MAAIRVVAAMNFGVAVQAAARLLNIRGCFGYCRYSACNACNAWCSVAAVALVADQRRTGFEQVVGGRAVGHVAVAAIVTHGAVVVNEWATFFHVAGVAGLYYAVAFHQLRTSRAVGVVAIRA